MVNATISYKFDAQDDFKVDEMLYNETTGMHYYDVLVIDKEGIIIFQITAVDDSDLIQTTNLFTISFENATQNLTGLETGLIIGGGVVVGAAAVLLKKKRGKFPR